MPRSTLNGLPARGGTHTHFLPPCTVIWAFVLAMGTHPPPSASTATRNVRALPARIPRCPLAPPLSPLLAADRHPSEEVNFLLPFTPMYDTNSLWLESASGRGDFQPLSLQPGHFASFYGNKWRHFNKINTSGKSRWVVCPRPPRAGHAGTGSSAPLTSQRFLGLPRHSHVRVRAPAQRDVPAQHTHVHGE